MPMSEKTRHQIERLKESARKAHKVVAKGFKGTAIAAGVGVAIGALEESRQNPPSDFDKTKPGWRRRYLLPAGLIGAGHFVKRRQYDAGTAMIALGGAIGYADYKRAKEEEKKGASGAGAIYERAGDAAGWEVLDRGWRGEAGAGGAVQEAPTMSPSTSPTRPVRQMESERSMGMVDIGEAAALVDI